MELIVLAVLAALVVLAIALGVRTVPQGSVWTVERFGAYTRLLQPGLNLMLPFVERVGHKMNVQEIVLDIPEQAVITRDNAAVVVDGLMYYRVLDPAKAAYGAQNLVQALTSISMTNIRSVIGAMDLDGALSGREEINGRLLLTLDHATDPWGVKVTRVELRKIEPPANLITAMNLQMTAERERRVGRLDVRRVPVRVGVDRDAGDPGVPAGPGHADRDLAPVVDQQGADHHIRNTPKRVSSTGAFKAAESERASTSRVSAGSMMPSSHSRAVA